MRLVKNDMHEVVRGASEREVVRREFEAEIRLSIAGERVRHDLIPVPPCETDVLERRAVFVETFIGAMFYNNGLISFARLSPRR